MKRPLVFLAVLGVLVSSVFLSSYTPDKEEELLRWSSSRKLTWDDYLGRPDPASDAAASTTTYLGIDYHFTSTGFTYNIESRFSKTRSWGLHKTDYILAHEQGHFDIAEVYARILHQRMSEYKFDRKTYQKDLKKIYEDVIHEKEDAQNTYDRESRHSIHRQKQADWLEKIDKMLEETEDYANY